MAPQRPGWVTGPTRKPLLEAGLDYLDNVLDPAQLFMLNKDKVWFDGERYWVPIQVGLPPEIAQAALDKAKPGKAKQS